MGAGLWFWIIYVVVGLLGGFGGSFYLNDRRWIFGGAVVYVLIGLLGWGVFGPPIK